MIAKSDQLIQRLLFQSALNDLSVEELQRITEQYPYFSAAQLLLLKKLQKGSETHARQKAKAALFVYNPLQIEALWNETEVDLETITEPEPVAEEEEVPIADQHFAEPEPNETFVEEAAEISDDVDEAETIAQEPANEPEIRMPILNVQEPINNKALNITFEPYHTVDYFASQGIKLSQPEIPTDRFGKQLKSFTEWLKTMKKVPTTAITSNTDGVGEKKVENLAAHSLDKADIITESMAEVWIKQGNLQKASEVYNKLSLQNPSKKAYFAAKIESLKKPN